jgi:omega-6 fatty acid desaturase (delta-12 desaturase)
MLQGRDLVRATKAFAQEDPVRSWWAFGSTLALLTGLLTLTALDIFWGYRLFFSILASLLLIRMFIIYHDYLHGTILRRSMIADATMTVFGLLIMAPPSIWKRSHDDHHLNNGQYFGTGNGTFPLMTTEEYARASRSQRLTYAITRHPITMVLGYLTVFCWSFCLKSFLSSPRKHLDSGLAILLQVALITSLAIYAPSALLFTVLIPLVVSAALGTYLFYAQHNFPDVKYLERGQWDYVFAALRSSSYLRLNPVLHWFTGNIGYHHVHHLNAHIPFYRLPEAMAKMPELQSPGTTSLHPVDVYRCLRLKLWDPQQQRMVSFRESRRASPLLPPPPVAMMGISTTSGKLHTSP